MITSHVNNNEHSTHEQMVAIPENSFASPPVMDLAGTLGNASANNLISPEMAGFVARCFVQVRSSFLPQPRQK